MDAKRWEKIKTLFEAAQELEPEEREKFLAKACVGDKDLRREVENLIASFESSESFMQNPAVAEAASLFEDKKTLVANQTTGDLSNGAFVAGTVLASRYRIIGLLGKGGMGEVYRAEDIKLDQTVALKFLPDKLEKNKSALQRFIGEVRIARQVAHGNVCRVFDIAEIDGRHFLSMEYIDGDDLSSLLRRIGRLPSERAIEIARQLCVGLHAIHSAGILHRDFKPANIIIDSKGKARITDFGIAGVEAEIANESLRIGTPAYMSPEQITGNEISQKSDIYALGLVLYEIFTGKQAFSADSISELIKKHQSETPTNPSDYVKGIDPLVESVIFQCLEKNPQDRPSSAFHVAMALPGGNPLQVALEAGATPSPEMVAAAPKKGGLRPMVAVVLLLGFLGAFVLMSVFNQNFKSYNLAPLEKPSEVLAEKSRQILQKAGYKNAPTDSVYRFEATNDFLNYASDNNWDIAKIRESLRQGQPFEIYFLYRHSPRYLEPKESENVTENEPPLTVANMANVKLDMRGRLVELVAVPPQIVEPSEKATANWNALFTEAGLDVSKFRATEPQWTPPVFADERRAWEGNSVDLPEIPIRIESAAFQGKPVFFRVVAPWDKPSGEAAQSENVFRRAGVISIILIYCLVIVGSILLARHNLKVGRGDLRGGFKLAIFLFVVYFAGRLIYADHVPTVWGELSIIYQTFAFSLISALFAGLIYIALEPFVRRYWSELLISWSRLLNGDFRDPLVGRDILVGGLLGIGHGLGIYFGAMLVKWLTDTNGILNDAYAFQSINGFPGIAFLFTEHLANAVLGGFILLFVLLGFYMLFKRKTLSIFLLGFLIFSLQTLIYVLTQYWGFIFAAAFNSLCFVVALWRFGLLGLISFWILFYLSYLFPMTYNSSNLYFPNTIFTFIAAFGLAIYSFYISLAGQSVFQGKFLQEE